MSSVLHSDTGIRLGFHGALVNSPNGAKKVDPNLNSKEWNIFVALNMIPVIGNLIAGIIHFAAGSDQKDSDPILRKRGIVEMTIVGGMVLALADIVVTIGRMVTKAPEVEYEPV